MRHRKAGKELGRNSSHRRALLRNITTSLFKYEQIETTDSKAKALRPVAEKLITLAKRGDLHARRQALAYLNDKAVTHRLFDELKDRFLDRQGGYLRIVKKGPRKGDGAAVSIVQLLSDDEGKAIKKKKSKKQVKTKAKVTDKKEVKKKTEKEKTPKKEKAASSKKDEGKAVKDKKE